MDGGESHRIPAQRVERGLRILALAAFALADVVAGRALADDPPSLRPLARRYADPSRLFGAQESSLKIKPVIVPAQAFVIPPEIAPPIEFAVDEPPAFVTSVDTASCLADPSMLAARPAAAAPSPAGMQSARRPPARVNKDAGRPPVHFADAEPPAFAIMGVAGPQPINALAQTERSQPASAQIPIVAAPVETPSLTVPTPPVHVASVIPDTPTFVSPAEPLNITIGELAMADQPPPAPGAESSSAGQSGAPGSFGEVEKLGDAPPSSTLEFLRQQAILLKPGQCQFDWGLNYTIFDVRAALPEVDSHGNIVGVANERERLQLISIPFAVRYGICDGLQCYVNAPLGWSNTESTADDGQSLTNNFVGLGDLSAGFNCQIMKGCGAYVPDVIASVGFIAPTGHATFATSLLAPNSALGQGFWDITCSILAVHTIDPVVFYYGGGYVHRFDASFGDNLDVDPGQEFDYVFGVGFAVNPWVTISGTFIGNYLTRFGVNDVSIPGSDLDLLRFRVSVTVVKDKHICEPFGEIGMTPDTPSRVGVTFTY